MLWHNRGMVDFIMVAVGCVLIIWAFDGFKNRKKEADEEYQQSIVEANLKHYHESEGIPTDEDGLPTDEWIDSQLPPL